MDKADSTVPTAGWAEAGARPPRRWTGWLGALALVLAVWVAYQSGVTAPFVLDDELSIGANPSLRDLTDLRGLARPPVSSPTSGRPILNLSYALNFAWSGRAVEGYHLTNLAIHGAAAVVLILLLQELLARTRVAGRFGRETDWLALVMAGVWALHPLHTSAVTYLSQRAESMMGLCYLLTVYFFLRGARAERPWGWQLGSVLACAAGMATKEVMVTAPVMVLLLDSVLVAGSFSRAWQERRGLYLALASTWLLLAGLMIGSRIAERGIGGGHGFTWWSYALTQLAAVPHYARLAVWPHPLIFDYDVDRGPLPVVATVGGGIVIVSALAVFAWALRRAPAVGLLGASFFVLLAPTSSVVPIGMQPVAESRMYLPLVPLAVAGVLVLRQVAARGFWILALPLMVALGALSRERNALFCDPLALWNDTVLKRPGNARARNCLGVTLLQTPGGRDAAIPHFEEALRLKPDFVEARNNLANALLARREQWPAAIAHYEEALRQKPRQAEVHHNLGALLALLPGRRAEAIVHLREAVRLAPASDQMRFSLGFALARAEDTLPEALACFRRSLELNPRNGDAWNALGVARMKDPAGRAEAEAAFHRAIALQSRADQAHNNLAVLLADQPGRLAEAVPHYERALEINPDNNGARLNLGVALANLEGRLAEGIRCLEEAARREPENAQVHLTLGKALLQDPVRRGEAAAAIRRATQLAPGWAEARELLAELERGAGGARR